MSIPGPNAPVIVVHDQSALNEAYETLWSSPEGGTILLAPSAGTYRVYMEADKGGQPPITIRSADPDQPAELRQIHIEGVDNVRIENVVVDSTELENRAHHLDDMHIIEAENITISNSVFQHDATGYLNRGEKPAEDLGTILKSSNVTFEDNVVQGYFHGLVVLESDNVVVDGNEFTAMQGDGMRFGGVQNVHITNNHMHDFYGSDQYVTHSDMIQFWGANTYSRTENILISGNVIDSGSGAASQSIFMRNESFGQDGEEGMRFLNVEISDNIIYNGHINGIRVDDVNGLTVADNTVLWNWESKITVAGEEKNSVPQIYLRNTLNAEVNGNISSNIVAPDGTVIQDNRLISYDRDDENFVGDHFINPFGGGSALDLFDLGLHPDSDWFGEVGASNSSQIALPDSGVQPILHVSADPKDNFSLTFDASLSVDSTGFADPAAYDFVWTFGDGTVMHGVTVTRLYDDGGQDNVQLEVFGGGESLGAIARPVRIVTKDIVEIDFEDGVVDLGAADATLYSDDDALVTDDQGNTAFDISGKNALRIDNKNDEIHGLDSFGLTFDMKVNDDTGMFLHFEDRMTGAITSEGRLLFRLTTDEGQFNLVSKAAFPQDDAFHSVGISYADDGSGMRLVIDGERAGWGWAKGSTTESAGRDLVFGHAWKESLDAHVDNIVMSQDPSIIGWDGPEDTAVKDEPVTKETHVSEPTVVDAKAETEQETAKEEAEAALGTTQTASSSEPEQPTVAQSDTPAPIIEFVDDGFLELDFENGFANDGDARIRLEGNESHIVEDDQGNKAFDIGGMRALRLDRSNEEIHDLDGFGLTFDMKVNDDTGQFLHFEDRMTGSITSEGRLLFRLTTDEGEFKLLSKETFPQDDAFHSVGISYADDGSGMRLVIDGERAGWGWAKGSTTESAGRDLVFGHAWKESLDAHVDNIVMSQDPSIIGWDGKSDDTDSDAKADTSASDDMTDAVAAILDGIFETMPVPPGFDTAAFAAQGEDGSQNVIDALSGLPRRDLREFEDLNAGIEGAEGSDWDYMM